MGAALFTYYTTGELKAEGTSITEGIGQGRITANLEGAPVDRAFQIPDAEAVPDRLRPARRRGPRASAARPASTSPARSASRASSGPGHTIVTVLCDYGTRYQSKLFNPEFLRANNLPVPAWLERRPRIVVPFERVENV